MPTPDSDIHSQIVSRKWYIGQGIYANILMHSYLRSHSSLPVPVRLPGRGLPAARCISHVG